MQDYIVRASAYGGEVRAFAVNATGVMREIQSRLGTWPTASAALGRTISAGAMMGAMLKGAERLTIRIRGGGPIGQIVVDANAEGKVRGYVTNPHVDFPLNEKGKLDVARAVGTDGYLYVIKDLGMKEPYRGSSPIVSGEIAEDFTYYFAVSEQTPSSVGLGVLVDRDCSILACGGFIVQLLPGASEETVAALEKRLAGIRPVSTLIREGATPEALLEEVLGGKPQVLDRMETRFYCGCSLERAKNALASLGKEELKEMVEKGESPEITCHFCMETYRIPLEEIRSLLVQNDALPQETD